MTYQELITLSPDFIRRNAMTSGHLVWLCEKNELLLQGIMSSGLVIGHYSFVTSTLAGGLATSMNKQQPTWDYSYF